LNLAKVRTEPLEYRPAADYFSSIRNLDYPIWLDSGLDSSVSPASTGRFDILSASPEHILNLSTTQYSSQKNSSNLQSLRDALSILRPVEPSEDIPFCGGLIGYLGYETNHLQHQIPARTKTYIPQVCMGLYSWALILDHLKKTAQLVFHPDCNEEKAAKIVDRFCHLTFSQTINEATNQKSNFRLLEPFQASQSQADYGTNIDRILDYLRAGDCYQVNLAQHFSAAYQGDCADAYIQLRALTPTPHGAYLGFDRQILSLSPERFIQIRGRHVESWPIKGTAPRSENPAEDAQLARQLSDSEKNRAENLMIVDLMRNDLSRCCEPGSIRVPGLYELHSFPTVHHLVSRITGELSSDQDAVSVLEHCLPGGSITGAPKRRAMEIISELESQDRGVYCGCVGYLSACGSMDTNIAIRTLEADGERLNAWGGGGIVIDSDRDSEYQETLDKIRPLLRHMERGLSS